MLTRKDLIDTRRCTMLRGGKTDKESGFWVSTRNAVIILVLFVLIVVGVGLMAGLIREPCPDYIVIPGEDGPTEDPSLSQPWLDPFLPRYLKPIHYQLYQYPDFYWDGETFYGNVRIEIEVLQDTQYLIVQYKQMSILKSEVYDADDSNLEIENAFPYDTNQYWVVKTTDVIKEGSTVYLYLEFTGSLVNGIVGYYKSTYESAINGNKSWLATSKFQPSDSRKAFPNFDEPFFKAQFTVTLKHWKNFTALSNTPVENVNPLDDLFIETTFERTVTMSSYLVAFIVTDFIYKENTIPHDKPHRIWTYIDKLDQVDYAMDLTPKIFEWFEQQFDMPYTLTKLDQVAVPDYPSGATEHWGLMTYRESRLLYDPLQVGDPDKQNVAKVLAHEALHNYFGNVITCQWWDEIWLNEAPARFYEHKAVDAVTVGQPDEYFDLMNQFVVSVQQSVMITDASDSSRPVIVPINNPDQATSAFDGITYNKGGSMLRMMENFMGETTYLEGLRRFLREHEFKSVSTQDLWDALQVEIGDTLNITSVMTPWMMQMGLPVVTITVEGGNMRAEQTRFMNDPNADKTQPSSPWNYQWDIPLTYKTKAGTEQLIWIDKDGGTFPDPRNADEWIKFNNKQTGFYRVNMPAEMWNDLASVLQNSMDDFDVIDRANILDDAFNLARAAQMDYDVTLSMTSYMVEEKSYFPWASARSGLSYIGLMLYGGTHYGLWRDYILLITDNIMSHLTTEDGGIHTDKLNRNNIIDLSCGNGHVECIQNVTEQFVKWIEDPEANAVSQNLRRRVYYHGMAATGTEEQWDEVWSRYEETSSGQEKDNLIYALAQTDRTWLMKRYLDYCMDPEKVRSQDFFTAVVYLSRNPAAIRYTWDWTRAHYDELLERFDSGDRYFGRLVPDIVSGFNKDYQLKEVEAFYAAYPEAGAGERPREQSLSSIRNNIDWVERNEQTIINWLKAKSPTKD